MFGDPVSRLNPRAITSRSMKGHAKAVLYFAARLAVRGFALGLVIVGLMIAFEHLRRLLHW